MVPMRLDWTISLTLCSLIACGGEPEPEKEAVVEIPGVNTMMAHGDHSAKNGGTVWMHGDLHFEVVLDPSGSHRIYFSDAARMELPAAVGSDVRITIHRVDAEPEELALSIDEFGESWVASGMPVDDPDARAMISFGSDEFGPYEIDVPFVAEPMDPNAPDPHKMP